MFALHVACRCVYVPTGLIVNDLEADDMFALQSWVRTLSDDMRDWLEGASDGVSR